MKSRKSRFLLKKIFDANERECFKEDRGNKSDNATTLGKRQSLQR
jgi:hypothetical protein